MKAQVHIFWLSFLLIFVMTKSSKGQNYETYKRSPWTWADPAPSPAKVEDVFAHEDAVYLSDNQEIIFGDQNEGNMLIGFKRIFRLKLLNEKGIKNKSTLYLPESLDPLYDNHCTPFKNQSIAKGQSYFEMNLSRFSARVIKADGRIVEASYSLEMKEEEVFSVTMKNEWMYKYSKSHFWKVSFNNLEPGDELEVVYEVDVPYELNFYRINSSRVFMNGNEPKQQYSLKMSYRDGADQKLFYNNKAEPDSTFSKNNFNYFIWNRKNLPGCMDEPGSQPYRTLPYINYIVHFKSPSYEYTDADNAERKYMPFWLLELRTLLAYDYSARRNAGVRLLDHQNELVFKFIKDKTSGIQDSLGLMRFQKLHTVIADSFAFINKQAMFREADMSLDRLGAQCQKNELVESSRYRLYADLINKCKLSYSVIFMSDRRYGQPNENYISPVWNQDYLFTIFQGNQISFVHPKVSDYGWYFDELPFYYENSTGLLLNYNDLFLEFVEKPVILGTPASSVIDNTRMSNVMVNVNLENNLLSFDAKVSLAGQYSTIMRPLYLGFQPDSINNLLYNKKISDIKGHVSLKKSEVTTRESLFPFRFNIRTSYETNDVLKKNTDGSYTIGFDGWFNYIVYPEFSAENRQLDFYPDFVGQDTYRYMLHFSKPIKITTGIETKEINNSMGVFLIKVSQPQPDELLIESHFVTSAEKIASEQVLDVAGIYKSIEGLNKSSIHFVIQD